MTISTEAIKAGPFAGNASTTTFSFSYKVFSTTGSDLAVVFTNSSGVESTKTLTTDYSVSLNADQDNSPGGSITTTGVWSPIAVGEKITILNEPNYTQGTDLVSGGGFFPNVIEDALDRSTILARRADEKVTRSIQIPVSDSAGTTVELPSNTLRANKAIVFDADGDVGVSVDNYVDQTTVTAASAAAASASALVAQSSASAVAFPFTFSTTTTMANPGAGVFHLNNSTLSSVTAMAVSATTADTGSPDISDFIVTWDDSTSALNGHLIMVEESTPANFAIFTIGSITDNSSWLQIALTHVDSGSSLFTNAIKIRQNFTRLGTKGDTGLTGNTGATGSGEGLEMTFESTTSDADQGAGKVWLNHASPGSATIVYMDDLDSNAANINSFVDTWDDSASAVKGRIIIKKQVAPENYMIFSFGGSVTSASTYSKAITCTHVVSAGTIADTDAVFVTFSRTGDKGDTGSSGTAASVAVGSVTGNTVSVGGSATAAVVNAGSSSAATLNFTFGIPVGATGATGSQGIQGAAGDATLADIIALG